MRPTNQAAVITSSVLLCASMLFGIAFAPIAAPSPSSPALQPVAVLTVMSGDVLVRTAAADFIPTFDGAVLYVGTVLRTGADARALITFFEGSTVELDPGSDITIEAAAEPSAFALAHAFGRTLRVVMHLTTADTRYEPTTPAATASVRGIDFEIHVAGSVGALSTTLVPVAERVTTTSVVPTDVQTAGAAEGTTTRANTSGASTTRHSSKSIRKVPAEALIPRAPSTGRSRNGDEDGADQN